MSMRVCFTSPLLIGGVELQLGGPDRGTARRPDGTPELPVSALRGAWRIALEALLRGTSGADAACAPVGTSSRDDTDAATSPACRSANPPCPVCRVFGNAEQTGLLRIESTSLADPGVASWFRNETTLEQNAHGGEPSGRGYSARQRVAINRRRLVAEDAHLFSFEGTEPGLDLTFDVQLSWAGDSASRDELWPRVSAAAKLIDAIGGCRNVGYGSCRIECDAPPELTTPLVPADESTTAFSVLLQLEQPTCIARHRAAANVVESRRLIPGTTLRGALAEAILRANGKSYANEAPFLELISEQVRFDDARSIGQPPRFGAIDATCELKDLEYGQSRPFPAPLSARTCKEHPGAALSRTTGDGHGIFDTLLLRGAIALLPDESAAPLVEAVCPSCGGTCVPATGSNLTMNEGAFEEPRHESITRVAMNRRSGRAADHLLYTLQTLPERTAFVGRVRNLPPQAAGLLGQLSGRAVEIGSARSRGLGRCRVFLARKQGGDDPWRDGVGDLTTRFGKLNAAWAAMLKLLEGAIGQAGGATPDDHVFTIDLHGDAVAGQSDVAPADVLGLTCGGRVLAQLTSYTERRGFSEAPHGRKRQRLVVEAGSTFLLAVAKSSISVDDLLAELQRLEGEGVGDQRHEGFGEVSVCHPFHARYATNCL